MEDDPAAYFETAIKDKNPRLFKLSGDRVLVIRRHQHPQYHGNRYASALAGQAVYGKAVVVGRKLARRLGQPRPTLDLHALQALTTKQVKATYADLKIKSAF
ncbi:hypothetical protein [Streptomyces sp. NPDC049879]|uniref:hypothetical protein n=1 Tax=Streptomyces sp. NPDC049879 TaxID=3365598 RepID=UPI003789F47D